MKQNKPNLRYDFDLKTLKEIFKTEIHLKLHLFSALAAIVLGLIFSIHWIEFLVIMCCIALVFITEIINTCFEKMLNEIHPEFHPKVGLIKDISAASVLIAAFISLVIGLMIFIPKIF